MEETEEYHCYHEQCQEPYFGTCDLCGADGCADHIAITSKMALEEPFSYFCHPCHDKRRKEYEARVAAYREVRR